MGHFPYHYWIAVRNEYVAEMHALAQAMKRPSDDGAETIEL